MISHFFFLVNNLTTSSPFSSAMSFSFQSEPTQVSVPSDTLDFFMTTINLGVVLIRQKRFNEALGCFREAIQCINCKILGPSSVKAKNTPSTLQAFYLLLDGGNCPIYTASFLPTLNEEGGLFVFGNPIVLTHPEGRDFKNDPISTEEYGRLSLVILYNMALTYHLFALEVQNINRHDGGQSHCAPDPQVTELLNQALIHYEMAYRILVSEKDVLASQAMVILNNVGHVHHLSGNKSRSRKCFEYLLSTMIYLRETGNVEQIHHWDSFFSNVMDLVLSQPGPAPAA